MRECLVHIGYQRTGSTWLQRHLFEREAGPFWNLEENKRAVTQRLVKVNSLSFDPEPIRAHYEKVASAMPPGRVPLISSERLCGSTLSGGYDTKDIAERLKAVFPQARILICVREQVQMIRSAYNNYLVAGGACAVHDFLEPPPFPYRFPQFDYEHFAYDRLVSCYHRLFGADRVLVMPAEYLRQSPADYVKKIVSFCGAQINRELPYDEMVNVSISPFFYPAMRVLNPFTSSTSANGYSRLAIKRLRKPLLDSIRWLDHRVPERFRERANTRLTEEIQGHVGERYLESNKRLREIAAVDLASFGYRLPSALSAIAAGRASAARSSLTR
jgi:hypothetical protein